jgi:chromosome segregation ATPase
MVRFIKRGLAVTAVVCVVGYLLFGMGFLSYARSTYNYIHRSAVRSVPPEIELQRAHDLLEALGPELQDTVMRVAQEEVELEELKREIDAYASRLEAARSRVRALRDELGEASFGRSRKAAVAELSRQFTALKHAEQVLAAKREVGEAREKSLATAIDSLKDIQLRRVALEADIARLTSTIRLVRMHDRGRIAAADPPQLARAERLVKELRQRFAVRERALDFQTQYLDAPALEETEPELLERVDAYLLADDHHN